MTVSTPAHDLTDAEHAAVAQYLASAAGLVFDASRRPVLAAIVGERVAATGAADLGAYLARVSSPDGADERQRLLDAVTIPETQFFRNPPQMHALRHRILPELLRRAVARGRALTIWSAGCSTGEEPYSLAMLALEVAESLPEAPPIRVVATDLSTSAVAATQRARYEGRSLQLVSEERAHRFFERQGRASAVVPAVRSLVEARLHNLVAEAPPFGPGDVDLVVCRNVTIYFAKDTTREVVGRFHSVLAAGGYLMLGHAETLWQLTDDFTLVTLGDAFVYRKDVPAGRLPEPEPEPQRPRRPLPVPRVAPPSPRRRAAADELPDPDRATELLGLAREAMAQTRYAEAAKLARLAATASPLEVEAYVLQGKALANAGDDAASVPVLRRAVYLAPHAGHALFALAGALARCGEHRGAATQYRAAAVALPATDGADLEDLLDGCDVEQLVALCRRLADEADRRAAEAG
jgi:chemotaxis protein methyltransferase CheR